MPEQVDSKKLAKQLLAKIPEGERREAAEIMAEMELVKGTKTLDVNEVEHGTFKIPRLEALMAFGIDPKFVPYTAWVQPATGDLYVTCRRDPHVEDPMPIQVGSGRIVIAADVPEENLQELAENVVQHLHTRDVQAVIGVYGEANKAMTILKPR